ncbi:MAG: endolytic transglycosylase MltG [Methylobacterium mesophilicum]|nr:endolytic transglycosylase MltG [Methylobacterium mesophilicum]
MTDTPSGDGQFGRRDAVPVSQAMAGAEPTEARPREAQTAATAAAAPEEPPAGKGKPPRRSKQSRNQIVVFLNFLVSTIVLVAIAAVAVVYFGKSSFEAPGPNRAETTFLVPPRTGVSEIAENLQRRNLITDSRIFQIGVRTYGAGTTLKAGEYAIAPNASMRDIMQTLSSGKSIMYSLTVPEGLTTEQALQRVATHDALSGDMPADLPPEGAVAADTLRFTRGTPRSQIVSKMVADQQKLVDEIWATRDPDLPVADKNEFVTLASIVEKETGLAEERPRVAAVFVNRLKKNMRLQSDPTILYGLFGGKGRPPNRAIHQSDIQKETPYNTYVIRGLPPGPIANPGRAALEAVAKPLETDDLYFVADGTGGHVFAKTLADHNRNVAKWRAVQKQNESGDAMPVQGGDEAQ